jgi:disulfide bond formation protein DsbB
MKNLPFRPLALGLFAVCTGMLAFGLYLQHVKGIEPCPMCIMQRYALATCGLIGLVAGLHNPGRVGLGIYGTLLGIAALAGGGVAVRQSWIQWFPPQVSECGPGLEYMLESFPLSSSLPMIFRGAGDCSTIDWTFLGLSIANWSFVSFATILVSLVLYLAGQKR